MKFLKGTPSTADWVYIDELCSVVYILTFNSSAPTTPTSSARSRTRNRSLVDTFDTSRHLAFQDQATSDDDPRS